MMCDLETGVCGVSDEQVIQEIDFNAPPKKITLYYVTDPICSHCWALEPVLNRFIAEYGHYFNIETKMGGLLPSWEGFSDSGNGIQQPADVGLHWREVGEHSRMPIDGTLWSVDPILSSYPPSNVYKVIQSKQVGKEDEFLRRAREAVFVFNQNISKDEVLIDIVNGLGMDGQEIVKEAGEASAQQMLEADFDIVARLGVRGFPTIIMINEENKGVKIVGARSLETYVQGLQQITQEQLVQAPAPSLQQILQQHHVLFSKEIEIMYDLQPNEVKDFIEAQLTKNTYRIQSIMNELYVEQLRS